MAAGRTSKEIADELGISESTVNWHVSNVFVRLGASSRAEAVALAMRDEADDQRESDDQSDAVRVEVEQVRDPARPPLALPSIALAFAVTLLLGALGGALIAEWKLMSPPAPASIAPSPAASQPVDPTARPLIGAPGAQVDPAPPEESPSSTPGASPVPNMPSAPSVGPLPVTPALPTSTPALPTLPPVP